MSGEFVSPSRPSRGSLSSTTLRSPMERKATLRAVLEKTKTIKNVDSGTVDELRHLVQEADCISAEVSIEEKVVNHDEVLLDAEILAASSRVLRISVSQLAREMSTYSIKDYAESLLKHVNGFSDEPTEFTNWSLFENEVATLFRRTPVYTTLCGLLEPLEVKVKEKPKRVAKRDALAPIKKPEAVVEVQKDEQSVEETVEKLKHLILRHYKQTDEELEFFRLILHPTSFGKTAENMLHLSFLVRDGLMQISVDKEGNPVVVPTSKEMRAEARKSGKVKNVQNVISLSHQHWKTLVELLGIKEPMIDFR